MIGEMIGSAAGGWLGGPAGAAIGSAVGGAIDHTFEKVIHKLESEDSHSDKTADNKNAETSNVQPKTDGLGKNAELSLSSLGGEHVFLSIPAIVSSARPT
ncbi:MULTISPECIES: hypothetical protein [unclassified Bradyrhizobium]|uniref:hypothetical protein n=1 Tax=unclassified Bradyrhizobium TaxID=2631580 RepID=UPI0013E16E38|nr:MULTISPECIES: hypothetical protein [unclassified Bradyrhizobium]MCK7672668.1 hypothetical protein [Bradyrhizobium sp. 2S1]QIG97837.1 hypothetical protein G6P99_39745 [Bradyrhizobium sp. 6(2017)]